MLVKLLCAVLMLSCISGAHAAVNDEAGVRAVIVNFTKAWNNHDAKAMAGQWEEYGDLIDPWGKKATSKRAVESIFIGDQNGRFKNSTMTQNIDRVRFLSPEIAIVDATAKLDGGKDSQGKTLGPIDHHIVWILRNQGEGWKVTAARPYLFAPAGP